jgi:hypothetical protein
VRLFKTSGDPYFSAHPLDRCLRTARLDADNICVQKNHESLCGCGYNMFAAFKLNFIRNFCRCKTNFLNSIDRKNRQQQLAILKKVQLNKCAPKKSIVSENVNNKGE